MISFKIDQVEVTHRDGLLTIKFKDQVVLEKSTFEFPNDLNIRQGEVYLHVIVGGFSGHVFLDEPPTKISPLGVSKDDD